MHLRHASAPRVCTILFNPAAVVAAHACPVALPAVHPGPHFPPLPSPARSGSDIMSTYMRNLGNTAVLSRQQEAALAGILQRGIQLQALAERLAAERGCDVAAVDAAALAAAAGLPSAADVAQRLANQREAKDLLMQYNVRLVINIAKRYVGNGIDIVDLIPGACGCGCVLRLGRSRVGAPPFIHPAWPGVCACSSCPRARPPPARPHAAPPLTCLQRAWWGSASRWTALTPPRASSSPPTHTGGSASPSPAPCAVSHAAAPEPRLHRGPLHAAAAVLPPPPGCSAAESVCGLGCMYLFAPADQARVVRLPSHVCETLYRINRAITSMTEQVWGGKKSSCGRSVWSSPNLAASCPAQAAGCAPHLHTSLPCCALTPSSCPHVPPSSPSA